MSNEYEVHLEFQVNNPLKAKDEESFMTSILRELNERDTGGLFLKDCYYVTRKSFEGPHTLDIIIQTGANIATIIGTIIALRHEFKKFNSTPKVFVKRKDGLYAEVREGMNEEEVQKLFSNPSEPGDFNEGQIVDVYTHDGSTKDTARQKNNIGAYVLGPIMFTSETFVEIVAKVNNDNKLINLIKSGSVGMSPQLSIRGFSCPICSQDYKYCEHEANVTYNGIRCEPLMSDWEVEHVALVSTPEDQRTRMTDLLIVSKEEGKMKYSWEALSKNNSSNRLRRIQRALAKGLLDETVSSYFAAFFNLNSHGVSTYYDK